VTLIVCNSEDYFLLRKKNWQNQSYELKIKSAIVEK